MQLDDSALLEVRDLKVHFPIRQGVLQRQVGAVRAVDGIGFELARGETLGLTEDELAFYDALGTNLSAQEVLGDDQLRVIAREVAETVRKNTTIDWTIRETARANLRRYVKRVLRKNGYPPDKQDSATVLVIEQAEQWAKESVDPDPVWRG